MLPTDVKFGILHSAEQCVVHLAGDGKVLFSLVCVLPFSRHCDNCNISYLIFLECLPSVFAII